MGVGVTAGGDVVGMGMSSCSAVESSVAVSTVGESILEGVASGDGNGGG